MTTISANEEESPAPRSPFDNRAGMMIVPSKSRQPSPAKHTAVSRQIADENST